APTAEDQLKARLPEDVRDGLVTIYKLLEGDADIMLPLVESWEAAMMHQLMWAREVDAAKQPVPSFNSFRSRNFNLPANPLATLKKAFQTATRAAPIDRTSTADKCF